jgi:hypothetical protein
MIYEFYPADYDDTDAHYDVVGTNYFITVNGRNMFTVVSEHDETDDGDDYYVEDHGIFTTLPAARAWVESNIGAGVCITGGANK